MAGLTRASFFHNTRPPPTMGRADLDALRSSLAVQETGAASTHNQARRAVLCRSRAGHRPPRDQRISAIRARKPTRFPTVLTQEEALKLIGPRAGPPGGMAQLR